MENLYYTIIVSAIIVEYLLSSVGSFLDLRNISHEIPKDFQDVIVLYLSSLIWVHFST